MFSFSNNKYVWYVIIGIMIVSTLMSYATTEGAILNLVLSVPAVLIAITFHEFAHAFAADKLGDETPRNQGRLSLNPLDHLDPVGCFLLVFAGFGWGKPVQINPRNFNRNISMEKGEAIVSLAGPLMNFILAIVFALVYAAIYRFAPITFALSTVGNIVMTIILSIVTMNLGLGLFNLIPLPPLDGSKILKLFLPYNAKQWFQNNEQIFYIVFLVIWITGLAGTIISPAISYVYKGLMNIVFKIFGM